METKTIPLRRDVDPADCWNLSKLYKSFEEWNNAFEIWKTKLPELTAFEGRLGESAAVLADFLEAESAWSMEEERLASYCMLRISENLENSEAQECRFRLAAFAAEAGARLSFVRDEILAVPETQWPQLLAEKRLQPFAIVLNKILRTRPHAPTKAEERILSLSSQSGQTAHDAFEALTDGDFSFGTLPLEGKETELSQSTLSLFLNDKKRSVREAAYRRFYAEFEKHKNTLAALYAGSVSKDIFRARARRFSGSLEAALFEKDVPTAVYSNLVEEVSRGLPVLHRYYRLRKKLLNIDELRHFDVYVPLIGEVKMHHTFNEAVDLVCRALQPLGDEYVSVLRGGLLGGWVDKYENRGKRSGAFSAGTYTSDPYILMNYKETELRDVFTLIHESGHSMHSYYCTHSNPFQHYDYTIFEAEVASTFNEQLLAEYLKKEEKDPKVRAFVIGKQIDDIIATLFRQTMFAEFELICHETAESGGALTLDFFRTTYRRLLEKYFGPEMHFEEVSDLEGLRIPHFYRAFYVFQYATGISAAIALAQGVLSGDKQKRDDYFTFLKTGGSLFPIESLKRGGVDMSQPEPIRQAVAYFENLLNEFEEFFDC